MTAVDEQQLRRTVLRILEEKKVEEKEVEKEEEEEVGLKTRQVAEKHGFHQIKSVCHYTSIHSSAKNNNDSP